MGARGETLMLIASRDTRPERGGWRCDVDWMQGATTVPSRQPVPLPVTAGQGTSGNGEEETTLGQHTGTTSQKH